MYVLYVQYIHVHANLANAGDLSTPNVAPVFMLFRSAPLPVGSRDELSVVGEGGCVLSHWFNRWWDGGGIGGLALELLWADGLFC
jgi:hypothetical protein